MDIFMGLGRFIFLIIITLFFTYVLVVLNRNLQSSAKQTLRKKAYLQVLTGEQFLGVEKGYRYYLPDQCKIGRNKDNTIIMEDPYSSAHNTLIEKKKKKYFISDMDSKNGTLLNGISVTKNAPLEKGDTIQIGDVSFVFDIG